MCRRYRKMSFHLGSLLRRLTARKAKGGVGRKRKRLCIYRVTLTDFVEEGPHIALRVESESEDAVGLNVGFGEVVRVAVNSEKIGPGKVIMA